MLLDHASENFLTFVAWMGLKVESLVCHSSTEDMKLVHGVLCSANSTIEKVLLQLLAQTDKFIHRGLDFMTCHIPPIPGGTM
ncbi:hypothetical protein CHARACLAT_033701 [Characodon lateralis]|uniref:Uncharacterized protein n=1 Tax=Characodon lateralis TaxID=208331 RepID=A0ABU7EFR9_9TELE|nr:hypothetical protein [Characodon lateralis]